MNEPIYNKAMPEIPFPLVHPVAKLAPSINRTPPTNDIMGRLTEEPLGNILIHIGAIVGLGLPESFLATKAPKTIPTANPSCHQFFKVEKHTDKSSFDPSP
jgi:hypothetical protein